MITSKFGVSQVASDVKLGVVVGLLLSLLFCAIALVVFLLKGSQVLDSDHTSLVNVFGLYLTAGVLGGLIVGLLLRLTKWVLGAGVVGFVAGFVLWFLVNWSINPQAALAQTLKSSTLLAAAFGVPLAIGLWYMVRKHQRTGKWS